MKTNKKREYENDFPSVTTILSVLRKIGLEMWYKYNTPAFCDEQSEKGKTIGTQIHEIIQNYIDGKPTELTTEYDAEIKTAVNSFLLFQTDNPKIKLQKSEIKMTSQLGYNGTLDAVAEIDGRLLILDWKTGKCDKKGSPTIYEEYLPQVAAYVKAYNEMQGTDIDEAMIIVFAKDKPAYTTLTLKAADIDLAFNNIFLPALKIYNAQKEIKKIIKGDNNA
jgi:hypothetical protein